MKSNKPFNYAILMELTSSARGNTSLESAVSLTKSLRWEIQNLGLRLAGAANSEEAVRNGSSKVQDKARNERELKRIIADIRKLLSRIEDAVPLINLAITASGASLSSSLPSSVSPSRLLQASTFLTAGDSQYANSHIPSVQVGPTFMLSLYMLFLGHVRPQNEEDIRETTWKEVIHKAVVKLVRVPIKSLYSLPRSKEKTETNNDKEDVQDELPENSRSGHHVEAEAKADEYAYQLVIVEDLNDGRLHTFEEDEVQPSPYDDIEMAGIREILPVHEVSKIFYADTGKILNIGTDGETNSPVLLLKRDINAIPPRRMMERHGEDCTQDQASRSMNGRYPSAEPHNDNESPGAGNPVEQHPSTALSLSTSSSQNILRSQTQWRLPSNLDPEWMAFEVYTESDDSDSESEEDLPSIKSAKSARSSSLEPQMTSALSRLNIKDQDATRISSSSTPTTPMQSIQPMLPPIRTSLSLLETLLRLVSLQQFQQTPHLSIPDELLTFFLSESATTGAANSDSQERKRLRNEARRRVGFDPYDESPVKRRGEDYQYGNQEEYQYDNGEGHWDYERGYNDEAQGYQIPDERYGTPIRYRDEGYDTHGWSFSPSDALRHNTPPPSSTPRTPPLLIQDRSQSPRSARGGRSGTPIRWRGGGGGGGKRDLAGSDREMRKGSPLARLTARPTDEGIGTSPLSSNSKTREREESKEEV